MNELDIPKGWEIKPLKTMCDFYVPMRDKPTEFDGNIPWLKIDEIKEKFIDGSNAKYRVSEKTIKEMKLRVYPIGTVLCSCSASIGRCSITTKKLTTNQTFIGIFPTHDISNEFLYYFLRANIPKLVKLGKGTTIPYISKQKFENMEIIFPNLKIQDKIVQKLDYLFNHISERKIKISQFKKLKSKILETSNEMIPYDNNVPLIFKKLYVEILHREFEKLKTTSCSVGSLSSLCTMKGGGTPSKANPDFWNGSIPWISPKDMKSYEINDSKDHITQDAVTHSSTNLIPENSVLIVFRSGILSRTLPISINRIPATINQDIKSLAPKSNILPDFLALCLISQEGQILKNCLKRVTTVHSLITEKFGEIQIPVPVIDDQKQICRDLYRKAKLLSSIALALKLNSKKLSNAYSISQIEQSILSSAFSGELLR